jgi:uracil-DNA glycosylase family 4
MPLGKDNPTCSGCVGANWGHRLEAEGLGSNGVMVIGGAPGEHEHNDRLPMRPTGIVGSVANWAIKQSPASRDAFRILHTVMCRPPADRFDGERYEGAAAAQCFDHIQRQIDTYKPKVILAMGDVAIRSLTGMTGRKQSAINLRGYILEGIRNPGIPVVATLDPAAILKSGKPALRRALLEDMRYAQKVAIYGPPAPTDFSKCVAFPSVDEAWSLVRSFIAGPDGPTISYDIETESTDVEDESLFQAREDGTVRVMASEEPVTEEEAPPWDATVWDAETAKPEAFSNLGPMRITQIQFAWAADRALVLPWSPDYMPVIQAVMGSANPKVGWNSRLFDDPLIRAAGVSIGGYLDDLMVRWHHLQPDYNKALQFVTSFYCRDARPWKHRFHESAHYGFCDVIYPWRMDAPMKAELVKLGVWESGPRGGYVHQVQPMSDVLDTMAARGVPFSVAAQREFGGRLEQTVLTETDAMQALVPDVIRNCHPKEGYKKGLPSKLPTWITDAGASVAERQFEIDEEAEVELAEGVKGKRKQKTGNRITVTRACLLEPFNPNSGDQILAYIRHKIAEEEAGVEALKAWRAEYKGVPVVDRPPQPWPSATARWYMPQSPKEPGKTSTGVKELQRLNRAVDDPLLAAIIKLKPIAKIKSSFVGTFEEVDGKLIHSGGWHAGADNRIHTTYNMGPATGQLAASNPNVLQCFTGDTEILTPNGWALFTNYIEGTPVAQYNRDGSVEFVTPTGYVARPSEPGEVIRIHTEQQIDLAVTRGHRCLLRKRDGELVVVPAEAYPPDHEQIAAGHYKGGSVSLRPSQIALIAALQADGTVTTPKRGQVFYQFQFARLRKIERMREALQAEGIEYREYNKPAKSERHEPQIQFYIPGRYIPSWWKAEYKYLGAWVLSLDARSFTEFATELFQWDGSVNERGYNSKHKGNVDYAQVLQCLTGRRAGAKPYRTAGRDYWRIDTCDRDAAWTTNRQIEQLPDQPVYCVSVPSTFVVVRRNGRVAMTGQSPKHGDLAGEWLHCIVAKPTHRLINVDFAGFHALTTGFEAEDVSYIRAARLDIHGILGYAKEKLPDYQRLIDSLRTNDHKLMPDEEILDRVKRWARKNVEGFKDRRDQMYKRTVLGNQFGMRPPKLHKLYPEAFPTVAIANDLYQMETEIWPKIFAWQDAQRDLAHVQRYLKTRYGFVRWFWNVYAHKWSKYTNSWEKRPGDDSEKVVAYAPANDAFGHVRDCLIYLHYTLHPETGMSYADTYGLYNNVHDSLELECPAPRVEEAIDLIARLTQRRNPTLTNRIEPLGLWCGIEAAVSDASKGNHAGTLKYNTVATPVGPFDFPLGDLP